MKREEIDKYIEGKNAVFIGWHPVPCPVYVIHVEYDSVDSDPFYPLYKCISQYIELDPQKKNFQYFSRLIGFDSSLLDYCFKSLKDDGMIRYGIDGFVLTEDARRKYVYPNSRPIVKVTGSFLIDGKSLKLLPEVIYQQHQELGSWDTNISAHDPIDPLLNPAPYESILKMLNDTDNKKLLHLELDGSNFHIIGADRRYLKGVDIIYYYTNDSKIHKDILYNGKNIRTKAVGAFQTYTIDMVQSVDAGKNWIFKGNLGYNVIDNEGISNTALKTQNDGWTDMLCRRYQLKSNEVLQINTDEKNKLPIINITETNLLNSDNPIQILQDCKKGFIDFPIFRVGLIRVKISHNLQQYVEFMNAIDKWDNSIIPGKDFKKKLEFQYSNWRNWLILLRKYTELERIDSDCYIQKY